MNKIPRNEVLGILTDYKKGKITRRLVMDCIDVYAGQAPSGQAYYRLAAELKSGKLTLREIDIAVMEYIHASPVLPEGIKNILAQKGGGGLVRAHFALIKQLIGNMELAYLRGEAEGRKAKKTDAQ